MGLPNKLMKKIITIICDEDLPVAHLLNSQDFEVIPTQKENTFAMTRRAMGESLSTGTLPINMLVEEKQESK